LISGFKNSIYPWVLIFDADGQFDIQDFDRFLPFCNDYSIISGVRHKRQDPRGRRMLGYLITKLVSHIFGLTMRDLNTGFKLFKRECLSGFEFRTAGAMINAEIFIYAKRKNLKIKEINVSHYPRKHGKQSGGSFKVIMNAVIEFLRLLFIRYEYHL